MDELDLIREKIYTIRGQRVMLDFDLAKLYGIETRVLKQAVRRNLKRFEVEDIMFELTKEELSRSQIVILNNGRGSNFKYMPFVFTELGVAMLSSVLNSETAIEINRRIMRAFVAIRQYITSQKSSTGQLERRMQLMEDTLNDILTDQNDINEDTRMRLELIEETLAELQVNRKTASRTIVKGFGKG